MEQYFRTTSGSVFTNLDRTATTIDNAIDRTTNSSTNNIVSSINSISNGNGRMILLSIAQYYQLHKQQFYV